jgi:type IV pilus assembly protein PilB
MAQQQTATGDLGSMLVAAGKITEEQLGKARELTKKGEKLASALVNVGALATEDEVSVFVGRQLNIGAMRLSDVELNPEVVKLIPLDIARKFNVIAVSKLNKTLVVAISDPNNIYVLDAIKFITGCHIQPVISPEKSIQQSIDQYYGESDRLSEIIEAMGESDLELVETQDEISEHDLVAQLQDKPLVKLVDGIVADAIRKGASDIHVETYEKRVRVRFRVDGTLLEQQPIPFKYRSAIVSRIKIMADLDISERRLPQDGRIKIKVSERTIDLRVSVLPTIFGEKVVMRILDPKSLMVDMTRLGFDDWSLEQFDKAIHLPYGIILVTGPTGSGKTTTLYSALKALNTTQDNIMTAEDPVEFNFDGINQVLVRANIGLTFAAALRSFLRQDPDIVMVGEIRDAETAEIAIRAALTGHLVFSTLHTNDAPSSINRLVDMGIPGYLVAAATRLIMAQRIVKKICTNCKTEAPASPEKLRQIGIPEEELSSVKLYHGRGCKDCGNTGLAGRIGIYEVMTFSPAVEEMVLRGATNQELRDTAVADGMKTLRTGAIEKMKLGLVTIEEVIAKTIV